MLKKPGSAHYLIVLTLSCLVLALQIILSSILRAYLKLPYITISFAFIGFSLAGIYSYFVYNQTNSNYTKFLPKYIDYFGFLTLIFFCLVLKSSLVRRSTTLFNAFILQDSIYKKLVFKDIILDTVLIGGYLSVSFFFLGVVLSVIYRQTERKVSNLYFFDLTGAALGCLVGVVLIQNCIFSSIPIILVLCAFLLSFYLKIIFSHKRNSKILSLIYICICFVLLIGNSKANFLELNMLEFKPLNIKGLTHKYHEIWSDWNSYSRISLIQKKNNKDLSTKYYFTLDNGAGNVHLKKYDPNLSEIDSKNKFRPVSMAFLNKSPETLLVMFSGAGLDMVDAHLFSNGQTQITGVELNPLLIDKAKSLNFFNLREFFALENIRLVNEEGRQFLESSDIKYDAIIYSYAGATVANNLGVSAYTGQYLYTVEGFQSVWNHLNEGGILGLVNNNVLRLLGILKNSLPESDIKNFSKQVIVFAPKEKIMNSLLKEELLNVEDSAKILIKKGEFSLAEVSEIVTKLKTMNMEPIYTPYQTDKNYPQIAELIQTSNTNLFLDQYSHKHHINIRSPTDDKPFIGNFLNYRSIIKKSFWSEIPPKIYQNYRIHLFFLKLTVLLILLGGGVFFALVLKGNQSKISLSDLTWFYYFGAIAVAFMFIEISLMNQFTLFLGNPVYSLGVILSSLLFSAALGGWLSELIKIQLKKIIFICACLQLFTYICIPKFIEHFLGLSLPYKFVVAYIIIIPLGICLGLLFPKGLKIVKMKKPQLVPLMWGINGYSSAVASMVSIVFSVIFGFSFFHLLAFGLYLTLLFLPKNSLLKD